jgi:hypothetical protein
MKSIDVEKKGDIETSSTTSQTRSKDILEKEPGLFN